MQNTSDSLNKRYFFKLSSSLIGFILNLATAGIVPRGLGVKSYGDFSFLTFYFSYAIGILNSGTSVYYYTTLSKRLDDKSLISFYFHFIFFASLLMVAVTIAFGLSDLTSIIWPNQTFLYILLGALYSITVWILQAFTQMADAYGVTVKMETLTVIQKVFGTILLLILFHFSLLNLLNFFYYQFVLYSFLIIAIFVLLYKNKVFSKLPIFLGKVQLKKYFKEALTYSAPLFLYSIISTILWILDRWLLQFFSGSVEQGYFGLAYSISMICFFFTTSLSPLLMREFSISHQQNNLTQMQFLFKRYMPILYSIAAYFSIFVAITSDKMAMLLGGEQFTGAALTISLMSIATIHSTYDNVSSTLFMATGRTKLYGKIGIINSVAGFIFSFFLMAPSEYFGLNMGSVGLSIKLLVTIILYVNVHLYINCKMLNLKILPYILHQIYPLIPFAIIGFGVVFFIDDILKISNKLVSFLISGFIYSLLIFILSYKKPFIFGIERSDLDNIISEIRKRIKFGSQK